MEQVVQSTQELQKTIDGLHDDMRQLEQEHAHEMKAGVVLGFSLLLSVLD